jgi:hypothetical protein
MDADLSAVTVRRHLVKELLRLLSVSAVPSGYRGTLTNQAFTDRRTDSAGTARHEGNPATELISLGRLRSERADFPSRCGRRHVDPFAVV